MRSPLLNSAIAATVTLVMSTLVPTPSLGQHMPPQLAQARFEPLEGERLKRLLSGLEETQFPEGAGGHGAYGWSVSFNADGTWEGYKTEGNEAQAYGNWRVEAGKVCVKTTGGFGYSDSTPAGGCFSVRVERENGIIEGAFAELSGARVVMKEYAYDAIARAWPSAPKQTQSATANLAKDSDGLAAQQALEKQRIALEKERLALERQRLAQEKRALEMKRKEVQERRLQQASIDRDEPVIEIADRINTVAGKVTLTGVVRDDSRIIRIEVAGRKVAFDARSGRFSADVQLEIGNTEIPITALDSHGNEAETIVSLVRKRDIPDIDYGRFHALVIGINDYKSLPKLKTALIDAQAVAETLEAEYGYTVHLLENPTRGDIIDKLDELRETLVEEDNLLIYYAGHGWLDEQTGTGYWMPVDAKSNRRSRWVSNADLTVALQGLFAKHVMVVADSCYSGTLTRSVKVPERNRAYLERIADKRTRVVLSSGGLEPVADSGGGKHSVFAAQFLKALRGNEGVMDGTKLFEQVRQTVVLNADQTPQYADIRKAGHEGGDFLFVRND